MFQAEVQAHPAVFHPGDAARFNEACQLEFDTAAPWLSISGGGGVDQTGRATLSLAVSANPLPGLRTAVVRVGERSSMRKQTPLHLENLTFEVEQSPAAALGVTAAVNSGGVVNNASFRTQISPGSLFSIFGTNLASVTIGGFGLPLPLSSNGTTVRLNGVLCPLVYLSPLQINAQAPFEVPPGTATLTVSLNGADSSGTVVVASASPGLYMSDSKTRAILQRSDGAALNTGVPAVPGEHVVLYGTGIGPISPTLSSGQPARSAPNLSRATSSVSLFINGVGAPIDFIGLTPGFVGLMQINTQIPSGTPTSDTIPVVVVINGVASQTAFISVRASGSSNPPPVISSFSADAASLLPGQSTTLRWNVSGSSDVSIDNGIGSVSSSGQRSVQPSVTTTYTLTARNSGGVSTASVNVLVSASAPVIAQFSADSTTIPAGQATTLRWNVSNASDVSIDNGIGSVPFSGSRVVAPSSATTYTLTARNSVAARTASVSIGVSSACQVRGGPPDNTYFIDYTDTQNGIGAYQYQGFTVNSRTQFVLRVVADFTIDAAIFQPDQLDNFINGRAYTGFAIFDKQFGTHSVTLDPGSYYVGVRNGVTGDNRIRYELDYSLNVPGATFNDFYFSRSSYVGANFGIFDQPFTVEPCIRYFLDGANTGVEVYVIPAGELDNLLSNRTFQYYVSYSSPSPSEDQPGSFEIQLPVGDYVLAFRNPAAINKAVTFTMERWR